MVTCATISHANFNVQAEQEPGCTLAVALERKVESWQGKAVQKCSTDG